MLTPENASTFWNTINKIDSVHLNRICESYFIDNLEKVVKTENFLKLEKELVVRVFYSNSSRQRCAENAVNPQAKKIPTALSVRAVTQWLTANSPEFSKINFANVLANKLLSTNNTPMELQ